jgi:hypothetical protein
MRLFIAGTSAFPWLFKEITPLYVLESFYYIQDWQLQEIPKYKMFLLDSGAFTFMSNTKKAEVNWKEYIDSYIEFINKHDIKYFFELDIDVVVGYENVKKITKYIEQKTNKQCIPVWHKSRGLEEWERLTKEYNYVAIGGIVTKEIKPSEYKFFPKLLQIASKNKCKVHGLGFTGKKAFKLNFYSVDSTNWLQNGKYGGIEYFNGKELVKVDAPKGKKNIYYRDRYRFLVPEYIKFQKYLDKNS